jgi:hypothetical protein
MKSDLDSWIKNEQANKDYTILKHKEYLENILKSEKLTNDQRKELAKMLADVQIQINDDKFNKLLEKMNLEIEAEKLKNIYTLDSHLAKIDRILMTEKLSIDEIERINIEKNKVLNQLDAQRAKDFETWQNYIKGAVTSKNKEIAAIAKAMAIWEIGINSHKAAMAAYSSLAGIPFIGVGLGIAAAAAALAYGAEQAANVVNTVPQLASGGMVKATNGGRNVVVSEGGNDEAVVPLDNPDVARRLQKAIGGGDMNVILRVGEYDLAEAVIRGYNKGRNLDLITQISSE